jgi:tripartite-type tricarboxylate transporter receptor subunit TctC
MRRLSALAAAAALHAAGVVAPAAADPIEDFYRGKTMTMLIGGSVGVSYDFVGRAIAAHMGAHIPGNPAFVVENMPGATGLIMTNHLYNRARRDGTVIGMPNTNVIFEPTLKLLSREGGSVQFDLEKFIWLGTPVQEPQVLMVSSRAPATSLAQMKTTKVVFGSSGVGADNYTLPQVVNRIWGTKNEIVLGYKSPTDIFVAMERGEAQGVSAALSTLLVNRSRWLRDGTVTLLMQFGAERARELPDLPTAIEQAPNDEAREMLRFIAAKFALARPLVLPPETPPDRVRALRDAYEATLKDPAFLADAKRIGIDVTPIDAARTTQMIHDIQTTPPDRIERLRAVINP